MPTNKNFYLRSMVIDRLLRTENGSSASEILEKVNQVLVEIGLHPLKRRDTILNDILEIENRHHVRVITWKDKDDKRIIRYRYEKLSFSIYNYPLTPQQVEDIKGALNLLMTFKGMPQYKWVEQLCSHFAVANEPLAHVINIHDDDIGPLCLCRSHHRHESDAPKSEKRVLFVIILAFLVRGRGCSSH